MMKRSPELLFLLYKFFKCGITYIPIDSNSPNSRVKLILNEVKPDLILTDSPINYNYVNNEKRDNPELAYVLYTSGTTGRPKGVGITKESLINFIEGVSEKINFSAGKRIACFTTISFDIFFLESVMALLKGLTIVLANEIEQRNPKLMAKLIKDNAIDMIQMTPSRMQLLLNHDTELACLKNVKEIMIGGEYFPLRLLQSLQEKTTAKIYNMYGPTETTIWSTISDLTDKRCVDIGRPIKNTEVYIVDENLLILPDGGIGEICISGKGLAKEYIDRQDLTSEKFIYLPQKPDVKVYRTGDMGRYLSDGSLECLGRVDNQIKIRGYRIELEEIEQHINQFEGIKQSIVVALETINTEKSLQAFYTSDIALEPKNISKYLASKIPEYMIPAQYKRIENFIQTANGKIDRKRVLECVEIIEKDSNPQCNIFFELTKLQKKIFDVIVSSFDPEVASTISLDAEFAGAGIDSITFIKIVVALEEEFDFEFEDEMLLITNFQLVRTMIEYVESKVIEND